jgi:hypothetical protein
MSQATSVLDQSGPRRLRMGLTLEWYIEHPSEGDWPLMDADKRRWLYRQYQFSARFLRWSDRRRGNAQSEPDVETVRLWR